MYTIHNVLIIRNIYQQAILLSFYDQVPFQSCGHVNYTKRIRWFFYQARRKTDVYVYLFLG